MYKLASYSPKYPVENLTCLLQRMWKVLACASWGCSR